MDSKTTTVQGIPPQALPMSKKNDSWRINSVKAYIDLSKFGQSGSSAIDYDIRKLYDYYNGHIDKNDYRHVISPYGKERKNLPAKIQNYNLIKPVVDVLLGEKARRPMRDTVTVTNADAITQREQELKKTVLDNLKMQMLSQLQGTIDIPEGLDLEEIPPPEHVAEFFMANYSDQRAILGQKALTFIKKYCELYRKFRKMWKHFLISGEMYSMRDVVSNEPYYEVLNPLDIDYDKDPDLDFVEDGDWACVRRFMYPSTVVDLYHDELTDEEIYRLEEPRGSVQSWLVHTTQGDDRFQIDDRLIEVVEVFWMSRKRIGYLSYIDEFGQAVEEIVDENYEPKEGESIEWGWINEVWEGTRIDGDIFVRMGPRINQRRSKDNPSRCKLPINGRRYSDLNSPNISMVSILVPYQILYNAYRLRLEMAIAKSKDILAVMDINAIPKDWEMDKFMHFVDTVGIMWVDYAQEGIRLNPQQQSVLDLSIKTIGAYVELLQSIRYEVEELSGVNRQRKGQTGTYEGKGVTQQAIIQSSQITEDLFQKMAEMEERDMQALMDVSQLAWMRGKKTVFNMPDGTVEYLDIDGGEYMNAEYGVFVSDSGKDADKLDMMKELSQAMLQNGTPPSVVMEALDSENLSEIKQKIKKAEDIQKQQEQAMQEAEMNIRAEEVAAKKQELEQKERDSLRQAQTKLEVALIEADSKQYAQDVRQQIEEYKQDEDSSMESRKLSEEERHNRAQEAIDRMEARIKKQKSSD